MNVKIKEIGALAPCMNLILKGLAWRWGDRAKPTPCKSFKRSTDDCGFLVICASSSARLGFVPNPYDEYRSFVRRLWPTGVVRAYCQALAAARMDHALPADPRWNGAAWSICAGR